MTGIKCRIFKRSTLSFLIYFLNLKVITTLKLEQILKYLQSSALNIKALLCSRYKNLAVRIIIFCDAHRFVMEQRGHLLNQPLKVVI